MLPKPLRIGAVLVLLFPALVAAHPTFTPKAEQEVCQNTDMVHDYNALLSITAGDKYVATLDTTGAGTFADGNVLLQCSGDVRDGAVDGGSRGVSGHRGDAHRGDFDGEHEWGSSGGLMPARDVYGSAGILSTTGGIYACTDNYGSTPHHGTSYTVADLAGPGVFSIGVDDSALVPLTPSPDPYDDDDESCSNADGAVTPDSDCDDFMTAPHIGMASARQDPAPGDPPEGSLGGIVRAVWAAEVDPALAQLPQDAQDALGETRAPLADVVGTVTSAVLCPVLPPGTPFPISYDGTFIIFITGAIEWDGFPSGAPSSPVISATLGHICGGGYTWDACFHAVGNRDYVGS